MIQRVLIVHNHYQLAGGEANVADNEAALLSAHGHAVVRYDRDNAELASCGVLKKLLLPFCALFSLRTYREVRRLIAREKIDVVHVHNTVPLVSPSVYYAAWSRGVPVVQTAHNYRFLCPNGMFYRDGRVCEDCVQKSLLCSVCHGCYRGSRAQTAALAATIALHRLLGTYRRIDAYVCLTEFARGKLSAKLPKARLFVRPNIVDVPMTPLPYAAHGPDYVFFGRLDAQKGVRVLLHAFEALPECRLTVIGDGPEQAWMQAFISQRRLQNVAMTGALPHEEALKIVSRARAFVMPTQLYEGLPLTVLESFALGTPVVGSQLGNVGALLGQSGGGFVFDQTNPDALVDCIRGLTWPRLLDASERALAAANVLCDREQSYRSLIEIYAKASAWRGIRA